MRVSDKSTFMHVDVSRRDRVSLVEVARGSQQQHSSPSGVCSKNEQSQQHSEDTFECLRSSDRPQTQSHQVSIVRFKVIGPHIVERNQGLEANITKRPHDPQISTRRQTFVLATNAPDASGPPPTCRKVSTTTALITCNMKAEAAERCDCSGAPSSGPLDPATRHSDLRSFISSCRISTLCMM